MEKVLMTTRETVERHQELCTRIVAAVLRAQQICDTVEHHETISRLLSRPPYLRIPSRVIAASLSRGGSAPGAPEAGLHFGAEGKTEFHAADLEWIEEGLRECKLLDKPVGEGRYRLFRYYPTSVVKNAQSSLQTLMNAPFDGFPSD
jgi:hypothetical protein